MARFAGNTIRRNKELRTTGETVRESPGHAGCRRSQWKKSDIHHCALSSRDRLIGKAYGFRWRSRNKGTFAESGRERRQAVCLNSRRPRQGILRFLLSLYPDLVRESASAISPVFTQLPCNSLTRNYQKRGRSGREQPAVFVQQLPFGEGDPASES
jgi:hypothetical protein